MIKFTGTLLLILFTTTVAFSQIWVEEVRHEAFSARDFMDELRNHSEEAIGKEAPDIAFRNLDDGELYALSDFHGTPVLLVFMRSTCGACVDQLPIVEDVEDGFTPDQLKVIHVSAEDEQTLKAFQQNFDVESMIGMANDVGNFPSPFQISVTPSSFIIDAEGIIRNGWLGVIPYHIFVRSIEALN